MKLVMMTQQNHVTMATVEQSVVIVIRAKQKCVWWGLDGFILLILVFSSRPLQSYHDTSLGHAHSSTTVTAILVTLMLVCALAALGCYVFKHKTDAFRFHYFRVRHTHTMLLVVLVTVFLFFTFLFKWMGSQNKFNWVIKTMHEWKLKLNMLKKHLQGFDELIKYFSLQDILKLWIVISFILD